MEGDPRESRSGAQTVETLPDAVGMRWSPVLEGEDIVAGVVVGAEEVALAVLDSASRRRLQLSCVVAPCSRHGQRCPSRHGMTPWIGPGEEVHMGPQIRLVEFSLLISSARACGPDCGRRSTRARHPAVAGHDRTDAVRRGDRDAEVHRRGRHFVGGLQHRLDLRHRLPPVDRGHRAIRARLPGR